MFRTISDGASCVRWSSLQVWGSSVRGALEESAVGHFAISVAIPLSLLQPFRFSHSHTCACVCVSGKDRKSINLCYQKAIPIVWCAREKWQWPRINFTTHRTVPAPVNGSNSFACTLHVATLPLALFVLGVRLKHRGRKNIYHIHYFNYDCRFNCHLCHPERILSSLCVCVLLLQWEMWGVCLSIAKTVARFL